jgi:hypothetical protein
MTWFNTIRSSAAISAIELNRTQQSTHHRYSVFLILVFRDQDIRCDIAHTAGVQRRTLQNTAVVQHSRNTTVHSKIQCGKTQYSSSAQQNTRALCGKIKGKNIQQASLSDRVTDIVTAGVLTEHTSHCSQHTEGPYLFSEHQ